ncbi:unnamed protein product [Paramecium octaurelia]|uniref:Uncharacterized protein n=1 Tax=Paramecium octaurelia TaxID=43137 RepID=A0A8S1WCM0_PAROT|nr:unnamed protein product [Paramecium octaurelia]
MNLSNSINHDLQLTSKDPNLRQLLIKTKQKLQSEIRQACPQQFENEINYYEKYCLDEQVVINRIELNPPKQKQILMRGFYNKFLPSIQAVDNKDKPKYIKYHQLKIQKQCSKIQRINKHETEEAIPLEMIINLILIIVNNKLYIQFPSQSRLLLKHHHVHRQQLDPFGPQRIKKYPTFYKNNQNLRLQTIINALAIIQKRKNAKWTLLVQANRLLYFSIILFPGHQ